MTHFETMKAPRMSPGLRGLRGPGFGPRARLEASAFTAPLPVDVDVEPPRPQEKAAENGAPRLESLSAEAQKEACGATILLGKLLAVLAAFLFVWWTFNLWHLRQHDAAKVSHLQVELAAAATERSSLKDERDELRSLQMALRHEKADAEARAFQATSQLGDREGVMSDLQEELQSTAGLAQQLQNQLAEGAVSWHAGLQRSRTTLMEVQKKVINGQKELAAQQGEISQLQNLLKAAEGRYNRSSSSLKALSQDAEKHQAEMQQQQKELQKQQKELQQQLQAAQGKEMELRRQLKDAQRDEGLKLREAAQHEAKEVSKVQEQLKNDEDFAQKLLNQLALAAQKRQEGEEKLATLQSKLQTKERLAKDVASSLEHLLDDGSAQRGPSGSHRRLKIK